MLERFFQIIMLCFLLNPPPACSEAAGEARGPAGEAKPVVYLVLRPVEAENATLVERYHLPSSLSAFSWSQFRVQPGGNVELQATGGYRLIAHKPVSMENLDG